ncbi:cardiolipin synthase [Corynebacterium freneyi]|uniref:Cardiolipin synthase n=1 Tax=Corynebacterium freneyi TaxID=134034 RepID=A0ABS4U767_9CORY|nr:cardiolipin synthase [Corynebacterium freneyi]MBP2332490.1 cardiolipin synthase [Corynebacterium freneyi]MCG7437959.1 cardiolipin synthase [Corynebacterium freneyi]UBI01315.1 cardiolipin synthase [Corynebacterium freneyi]
MDWMMNFFTDVSWWQASILIVDYVIKFIAIGVIPENRNPSSSTAWLLVIMLLPVIGLPLFLLLGSQTITGRRNRIQAMANELILERTKGQPDVPRDVDLDAQSATTIRLSRNLTGIPSVTAVENGIYTDYDATIDRMIELIDQAERTVHVQMYIFALDSTTERFVASLERAHDRGVEVKVLVDPIGSYKYPGYRKLKKRLDRSGIPWHPMLPVSVVKLTFRRLDLRNHRKIVTIDGQVGFMGSMNLIEPEYQRKKNHQTGRQWVDTMIEVSGQVALHLDAIFAIDWTSEEFAPPEEQPVVERAPYSSSERGNVVQVLPSGPGYTTMPNLRVFNDMIYSASRRLIVVSPYFVPDESMLVAITSAAYAGVRVELYVNEQSDQFMVGHAQQSYYQALLDAGVIIYRYPAPKILHSKFMVVDDEIAVFGSSNMDMRSFGLNYEISMIATGGSIVPRLVAIADDYRELSSVLTSEQWEKRPWGQRYLDSVFRLASALV